MAIVVALVLSIVVLAALAVLAAEQAHHPHSAKRALSREAWARDRARWGDHHVGHHASTGRDLERAAAVERQRSYLVSEPATPPPVAWHPPSAEELGVSRRQFLNRGIFASMVLSIAGFGSATLAYLWPTTTGGFGSKVKLGSLTDVNQQITAGSGFAYYPEGRMWVVPYPASALPLARAAYSHAELAGMEEGVLCLYQKCVHLGCRVPACLTSQWFECPCHGSQYNHVGEKKAGPAPRGLDRFAMSVSGGMLTADTGTIILGPPIGTDTTGQEPEGPHCVVGAE